MNDVLSALAYPPSMIAVAVVAVALLSVIGQPGKEAALEFASALALALEFLLAAGLLRLSAVSIRGLGVVAAVIVVRQIVGRGLRFARGANP